MKTSLIKRMFLATLLLSLIVCEKCICSESSVGSANLLQSYTINRRVSDFPAKEDFSTPEATYTVINRALAEGNKGIWRRISVKRRRERMPQEDAERVTVSAEIAQQWLNAVILEVRIFSGFHAVVIAKMTRVSGTSFIDYRLVDLEDGKWLNVGASWYGSVEEARSNFSKSCAEYVKKPVFAKIENSKTYIRPFVKFLEKEAKEPESFVMNALTTYKLVIIGEIHHRPRYWSFLSSIVTNPEFPKHVGVIYMELPSNNQKLIDNFLSEKELDIKPVIKTLQDVLWMGWPDQAMLDFFITVWMVNQNLDYEQKLRVVLVDMQRPWSEIQKRDDWGKYEKNSRDEQMANNIISDISKHPEKRNSLFIVGVAHAMLGFKYFDGSSLTSAGWYLKKELGQKNVYAFFPHCAVGTNWGRIDGRINLGLFDSAFAEIGNKPIAFPLTTGPFGKRQFDALSDEPVNSSFSDGYSAYLYLGPLETEIFSPIIAGFYTNEFVKEIDKRYQIMFDKSLTEGCGLARLDSESFIEWMSNDWGKPRWSWREKFLGPITAWHNGGRNWKETIRNEKHLHAMEHTEEITQAAKQLFENIRDANYDYFINSKIPDVWNEFPTAGYYTAYMGHNELVEWICKTFKNNPIVSITTGEVFVNENKLPTVPYKLSLKDGTVLEGNLPFEYELIDGDKPHWHGIEGIDWHLQPNS